MDANFDRNLVELGCSDALMEDMRLDAHRYLELDEKILNMYNLSIEREMACAERGVGTPGRKETILKERDGVLNNIFESMVRMVHVDSVVSSETS